MMKVNCKSVAWFFVCGVAWGISVHVLSLSFWANLSGAAVIAAILVRYTQPLLEWESKEDGNDP